MLHYTHLYILLCAFSLVVDHDLLKETHTDFSFFMPQNPSINNLNFYCIKQIVKNFPCVCVL